MKLYGAVIIEQGVTFAILAVKRTVTQYTARAMAFRQEVASFFPNMPIILMSKDANGKPHYYGRKDIVDFLNTVPFERIPWKEYTISFY